MKTNIRHLQPRTHEGSLAPKLTPEQELSRTVLSCLMWEDTFYEDGVSVAERIKDLASKVSIQFLAQLIDKAKNKYRLRHVPLYLLTFLIERRKELTEGELAAVICTTLNRVDDVAELISLYWKEGKKPIASQMRKGIASVLRRFDEYQLGKYQGNKSAIKLVDVMNIIHPKPLTDEQKRLFKGIVDGTLKTPDTWEVALSGGADKKETFERLLREKKLGYLALLRNLRNMAQANVDETLVREAILERIGAHWVMPFRFIAASRQAPQFEKELNTSLLSAIRKKGGFEGRTVVLVDVSGSMNDKLSAKSDMTRMDAACSLASLIDGNVRVFSFSTQTVEVPHRLGLAGVDAIKSSQQHSGTYLAKALSCINDKLTYDRIIVVTDEQNGDGNILAPLEGSVGYMINVGTYKNGIGYGKWVHIDGFSEQVIDFIKEYELSRQSINAGNLSSGIPNVTEDEIKEE